jgi:hypothetical protein
MRRPPLSAKKEEMGKKEKKKISAFQSPSL